MMWQWIVVSVLVATLAGMASYLIGKRVGYLLGRNQSESELPILMRKQVLLTGKCPVCDARHGNVVQCFKRGD